MATMNGDPNPDRQTETIGQLDAPGKIEKGKIEKGDGLRNYSAYWPGHS